MQNSISKFDIIKTYKFYNIRNHGLKINNYLSYHFGKIPFSVTIYIIVIDVKTSSICFSANTMFVIALYLVSKIRNIYIELLIGLFYS